MKVIPVQKSVPLPEPKSKYPFDRMEIGDSFFVDKQHKHISSSAFQYGKGHGKKFSVRKTEKGFRVWRVK